jgi:hypothetical protein
MPGGTRADHRDEQTVVDLTRQLSNFCQVYGLVGFTTTILAHLAEELEEVEPMSFQELTKLKRQLIFPPETLQRLLDWVYKD